MKTTKPSVAEIELVYRHHVPAAQRPKITCSTDAHQVLRKVWDEGKFCLVEQFRILLLDRANRVMGTTLISTGGTTGTVVDPKLIFAVALKCRAAGIILAHNHPSGNLQPSQADLQTTKRLKQAGEYLDLPVLDHLILSPEGYYSMVDHGTF